MEEQNRKKIEEAVTMILEAIGEDTKREGLIETPARVARMYEEVFSSVSEKEFNNWKIFTSENEGDMVVVKDIEFYSMCEHHLLPFFGKVHVAYLPKNRKVSGLSKIARMVEFCSKRPSVQENLTIQIAKLLQEKVHPCGVAVAIEAEHLCMSMRGIKSRGSVTKTIHYEGSFKENRNLQLDFMQAIK